MKLQDIIQSARIQGHRPIANLHVSSPSARPRRCIHALSPARCRSSLPADPISSAASSRRTLTWSLPVAFRFPLLAGCARRLRGSRAKA
eukprot:755951-Hanusia_phi.AAC.1